MIVKPLMSRISSASINIMKDAAEVAKHENGIVRSYDNMKKLIQARPGFTQISPAKDEQAVVKGGFKVDAFMRRYLNKTTGETEQVLYGNGVQRTVYNSQGKPIEHISFDRNREGLLQGTITVPAENGAVAMLNSKGEAHLMHGHGKFDEVNAISNYGVLVDTPNGYATKYFNA